MEGFSADLKKVAKENEDFRRVLFTGEHSQLVVMTLEPGEDIGKEVHAVDQILFVVDGAGKATLGGRERSIAMPSALVTSAVLGVESIDHPITRRDQASRTTAQYTLPSLVGCSVMSVPKLVGMVAMKLPLDAIAGGGHPGNPPEARPPRDALDSRASHQELDGLMADDDPVAEGQISMDASNAVGAAGRAVRLADQFGEPRVTDEAR
ncbi:MAG TPA: hypothetical protein VHK65_06610 [Candidatus Dormibacteraeota bacterium]|nr:hypothetical protein [Candidatus Dormibacteraeota bacterium]